MLFLSHNAQLEGAPLHLLRLAALFHGQGHQCDFVVPQKGPLLKKAKSMQLSCSAVRSLFSTNSGGSQMKRLCRRCKPVVVFVNTILGFRLLPFIRTLLPDAKLIWLIHESERAHYMRLYSIDPEIFAIPDRVVFASKHTQDIYNDLDRGNFCCIHYGINVEELAATTKKADRALLRRKYNLPQDARIVTCLGTICPRKGQFEFVTSGIKALMQRKEDPLHFMLVGNTWNEHKPYLARMLKLAQQNGFSAHVHYHPATEKVHEIYALSDIFVCNSFIESLPFVVIEAMACGLPIIASATYGTREQIEHRKDGLLVLPGNTKMLSKAILELNDNPETASILGKNAQAKAAELFSEHRMLAQYCNMLEKINTTSDLLLQNSELCTTFATGCR